MSLKSFYDHEYFLYATFYDCDMRFPQNFLQKRKVSEQLGIPTEI